ncbi:MAG: prealbumin-like fold domain-containing protein, partial [Hydrogenophaga sp.]|uniref:prealbumin-like fold domain-containing protein n=1 Tax=Hydrogenophaga sp. TaxID=1904254 RepID=UPI004034F910
MTPFHLSLNLRTQLKRGCVVCLCWLAWLAALPATAATLTLSSGTVPANQAWVDGNQWAEALVTRTLTLPTGALPNGSRVTGLTVNVTFSKHDGPNCYNPSNASSAGSPYPLGSGLWNSGACPIEPTTSPNYPDNTTLGNSYPDEIYLAVAAPNGVSTVLVPVNRYVTTGGAANYANVAITFSDAAAQAIPTGSTPVSGSFRPITAFSAYNNIDPEGNWVLTFGDNYSEDPFRIVSWGVTLTYDEPPTLQLTKVSNGGVGTFTFTGNNGWASQSITTTTAGVGVAGATQSLGAATTATTINESLPAGWQLGSVSCTGMGSGGTATVAGSSFTLNAAATAYNADILCTVTNTRIPILRLSKSLPDGRVQASDQFTLNIAGAGGPATATTTGSTNTPTQNATLSNTTAGSAYTLSETSANLAAYVSTYACTNARAGGQTPSGSGTSFSVTPAAGDDLSCVFTNAWPRANLSVLKTASPSATSSGGLVSFTLTVSNAGPNAANGAVLRDAPAAGLDCTEVGLAAPTCVASGGAACPGGLTNAALLGA